MNNSSAAVERENSAEANQTPLAVSIENVMGSSEEDPEEENAHGHNSIEGNDECENDEDDITVIMLDPTSEEQGQQFAMDWIEQTGPEMEERRRNVLLLELRRVQRASFLHFALLCLIPAVLLAIVLATVFGEDQECHSEATYCELEPRTFVNAFVSRCVCDPIPVSRYSSP